MFKEQFPNLIVLLNIFVAGKKHIVSKWTEYEAVRAVLQRHHINTKIFVIDYAEKVFDYFMQIIRGKTAIGKCPMMTDFLNYLKDRDVSADELFVICSHFRKSMLYFMYDTNTHSGVLFDEISDVFDLNFSGVLKIYTDRIYQKELELEKNVKLLNEYKSALDESSIVSKADINGIITYANDNLLRLCGYSKDELIGQSHNILRHRDMPDLFFDDLWNTILAKKVFKAIIKNRMKNGNYFYVDSTIVPIVDAANNVMEYMGIGYEVTKLIDARQQAVDAEQAKDYFLSNMSHEIRTPLNAILGFVTLLKDENTSMKHKKYLDIIHNSGENLLSIINDILDFSKLRSGEFTVEDRPFNLHQELSNTLELFTPVAHEKKIVLLGFIDPYIPYELISDSLRIKQIVANFLSNAIKFTPYRGKIEVEAAFSDGSLNISVADNGIGIAQEDHAKIFNAFSQTHESENYAHGGTGLGLSICLQLAEHMNGSIELMSEAGKGSTFILSLPVRTGDSSRVHEFDWALFQKLRLALLQTAKNTSEGIKLLRRYWEVLALDVRMIDDIKDTNYDLLFFVDSDINDLLRRQIVENGTPAIAIMEYLKDTYDTVNHIAPLNFPVYCSKLYNTFREALQLTNQSGSKTIGHYGQRRFKGSVLVAEDNEANQELIKIILHRYGLDYAVVSDGLEAFSLFESSEFDMVLMDEQMPNMNGTEAMQKMIEFESENGCGHTPVVALTANVIKGTREQGLSAGYDAFLEKPIIAKEIEKVFEQFIEEDTGVHTTIDKEAGTGRIHGLDEEKLLKDLMLRPEQLIMLLNVFITKMDQLMSQLKKAVALNDFDEIARLAHNIKGSSSNFRIESLHVLASAMEDAASSKIMTFDYMQIYSELKRELSKISIGKLQA